MNFVAKNPYNRRIAKNFHDTSYYENMGFSQKNMEYMDKEKARLKTENKEKVTLKINQILGDEVKNIENNKVFLILEKIYEKNQEIAFNKIEDKIKITNSDLLNLVADPSLLMVAYRKVKKNSGAMTEASEMSNNSYEKLNSEQKSWVNKTTEGPDGINKEVFETASKLIKGNQYPCWGASRRIYVDKPGNKEVKRPITIPPFMDKVIQEAITMVLMAIYEPYFEVQNCSFGFRPNKGVHDAILPLTTAGAIGLYRALEGDIKSAYDKVDRQKLIEILGRKIKDRKFLNFIKTRLHYERGIDSPYLWNIYMLILDEFIVGYLKKELGRTNILKRGKQSKKVIINPDKRKIERSLMTLRKLRDLIKSFKEPDKINQIETLITETANKIKSEYGVVGEITSHKKLLTEIKVGKEKDFEKIITNTYILEKKLRKERFKYPRSDPNRKLWRFIYVRYADDWILLTNMCKLSLERVKNKISNFLMEELSATLSIEKTLITDIRKAPAHFLGFEIHTYKTRKIARYKRKTKEGKIRNVTAVVADYKVYATPDRQRQIERLHMKGYCDKEGFPREIGFLTKLDDFIIIERFNLVLMGLALYYSEFVRSPKRDLSRWIYIIRYSCFKTLAQKHKMSMRQIFKRYLTPKLIGQKSKEHTIKVDVINIIDGKNYIKTWRLHTLETVVNKALSLKRKQQLNSIRYTLNNLIPVEYIDQKKHRIINDNFYDKIMWIS